MKPTRRPTPRYVICVNNTDYPVSLELHKLYRLVSDEKRRSRMAICASPMKAARIICILRTTSSLLSSRR